MERSDLNYRLVAASICIYIYLFVYFRIQTIIVTAIFVIMYFIIINIRRKGEMRYDRFETERRKNALNNAKLYLSPYKSIWKNLKLSNKYCYLRLGEDGVSITGVEKIKFINEPYRVFSIVVSRVHSNHDLWDMFCLNFDHQTTYDGLLELCHRFKLTVRECVRGNNAVHKHDISVPAKNKTEKTDVNNASEIELTALPGISIVMSKKIIKKREEIGGFKNVDEFFIYIKLKQHMEKQLRELICVNKMKGSLKIEKYTERKVDL